MPGLVEEQNTPLPSTFSFFPEKKHLTLYLYSDQAIMDKFLKSQHSFS